MGEWGRTVEGGGEGAELVDVYGTLCFICVFRVLLRLGRLEWFQSTNQ